MLKKAVIGLAAFVILLMMALTYVTARFVDHKAILAAQAEAKQLRTTRDSILAVVATRESLQAKLRDFETTLESQGQTIRTALGDMEQKRREAQLGVRRLAGRDTLTAKLNETFPEFKEGWRVTDIYDAESGRSVEYLMSPVWFTETFIIDHQNSASYEAQKESLLVLDSLQQRIKGLKDSVLILEQQKTLAFRTGYDSAYAKYEVVNQRYIDLLAKPPQVKLGFPNWATILGTAGLGFVAGVATQK